MHSRREWMALLGVAGVAGAGRALSAADWPQYRGPNLDGTAPDPILTQWPNEGPKVLWKIQVGSGFGSWAVSGGKAFLFQERGGIETCVAYNAADGKELWATPVGNTIAERQGGIGPRSTPAVYGGKVYVLSSYLILACMEENGGKILWKTDLAKEYGGQEQFAAGDIKAWGCSASPLVHGNLVYVCGGGAGQALMGIDKDTGKPAWKGEDDQMTHASPVLAKIGGVEQVLFYTKLKRAGGAPAPEKGKGKGGGGGSNGNVVSVEPLTGKVLWRAPIPFKVSTASNPVVWDDIVYASAGYGVGTFAWKISRKDGAWDVQKLWSIETEQHFCHHWTTPVVKDGHVYGIFGFKAHGTGPLKCVEIATGKEKWSKDGFGSGGGTILVGGTHILAQAERGPLVLVEAKPDAYVETARAQQLAGADFWTMAVAANGKVFARASNAKSAEGKLCEAACLDLRKA